MTDVANVTFDPRTAKLVRAMIAAGIPVRVIDLRDWGWFDALAGRWTVAVQCPVSPLTALIALTQYRLDDDLLRDPVIKETIGGGWLTVFPNLWGTTTTLH